MENVQTGFISANKPNQCALDARVLLPILPVKIRVKNTNKVLETLALLDPGSTSSFCTTSLMTSLNTKSQKVNISTSTIQKRDVKSTTNLLTNLEVMDVYENICLPLQRIYTKPCLPVIVDEIPTQEEWPHLQDVCIPNADDKMTVGILIGSNYPELLQPIESIASQDNGPYATRTVLGWVVNGPCKAGNKVKTKSFLIKTKGNDVCGLCADVVDSLHNDKQEYSHEQNLFMSKVKSSIKHLENGHYQISLPIKSENIKLPDNKSQALQRLHHLKGKFVKDHKLYTDYKTFIDNMLSEEYAVKVKPQFYHGQVGRVWRIPHHSVYHPRKSDKIRVVFDCAARFKGTLLNDNLLQGPDLANSLIGVLSRFRMQPIALMGDITAMFHQVHMPQPDRDLCRFLWWKDGD